ncbi:MAG TPA: SulP family inorganic anion transporter [Candidatus Saccharimonadales bacterium]|nr:SulP family inorganic anion transporter [Candidatus Saccharimonadales bacterium]
MEFSKLQLKQYLPKSILCLKDYSAKIFAADLAAGVTVGLVALPLAMAFAIASGLTPQAGIYCAVVTGFIISLLGGSKMQIGGPTGAFVVVIAGILAKHGIHGLFLCTMMAGVMLVIMGFTGLGKAVQFIPRPVVMGFTNGIAVLIASTQIRDFFGLRLEHNPGEFFARMKELIGHVGTVSLPATTLAIASLAIILLTPRVSKRVPGYIVAMVGGTAAAALLHLHVETIGTRFGGIPSGLPHLDVPEFHTSLVLPLISSAVTIAMLGAIESLMSAVVADNMSGDKHNPNVELIAQGVANIVSPIFGGLPATGAIARTATNIRSGAKTPVAGIIHSLTLLAVLLFAAPLARFIPMAVLASILFVVSYNMGQWGETYRLLQVNKSAVAVWLVTFALTVMADLTTAVEFGMILAALTFIRSVAETTSVSPVTKDYILTGRAHVLHDKHIPDYVEVFTVQGALLFGAAQKLEVILHRLNALPPIVILRLRGMSAMDSTGLGAIEDIASRLHDTGRHLLLCGAKEQPSRLIHQAAFEERIGAENICSNIQEALDRAKEIMDTKVEVKGAQLPQG